MIQTQALNYILESKDSSFITSNSLTKDYFSEYISEFAKQLCWEHRNKAFELHR